MNNKTTEKFIIQARKIHGDKYNYSQVIYINNITKILIQCNTCNNKFWQIPSNHLQGKGCPFCGIKKVHNLQRKSLNQFIEQAKKIHDNKYDYSRVKYLKNNKKVEIICKKCGKVFLQTPTKHLLGQDCICYKLNKMHSARCQSKENFIEKAKKIHGNKYNYDLVEYYNCKTKVKIQCKKCGKIFMQTPMNHLRYRGCPSCRQSKGENQIEKWLKSKDIRYITQKRFKDCKDKQLLPFDFYLPDYNLCIEFQGRQHYFMWRNEINQDRLEKQRQHDQIKKDYCKKNNIRLLEIKYNENINQKLKEYLK